ncbi:ETX/MTX2 family pore-forming toxin [Bacillus toyonensis]|uniref:ETX/MTX2 family pore-forming toxin n=1 Tax=Bacillus toyonensis TaxID=155322 RepID=UPI000BF6F362|nr:ETX/MTX2 family pore-forming toxin [Bacillus toyonensis]PGA73584.1 hypothetical protein COL90_27620 [Bacillus toyonensis]
MRNYKKLAVAMPLAGMIMSGVGVLGGPASSFADTMPQAKVAPMYTNLAAADHYQQFMDMLNSKEMGGEADNFEIVAMPDSGPKNIHITEAKPINAPENTTEVMSYHNVSGIQQSLKTPSKKITHKNTLAIKNGGSIKTSIESKTKFSVQVPFFAKGEEELKVGLDVTYNRESTDTAENTQEFTIPEQTLLAQPGGTTRLIYTVQSTAFSGTYNTKAIFKQKQGGEAKKIVDGKEIEGKELEKWNEEQGYYFIKGLLEDKPEFGIKAPEFGDIFVFDDVNKKVYLKDGVFTFEGQAGHQSTAEAVFIPDDNTKPEVKMPLAEYNRRVANGISLYAK